MAELKTKPNDGDVMGFLNGLGDEKRRRECLVILELMKQATGSEPKMWGSNIVGFGLYHYKYASGREADWFMIGFSPRKQNLTLYVLPGVEWFSDLQPRLGKHTVGKSCLYIKKLEDVDLNVLRELFTRSVEHLSRPQTNE